MLWIIHDDLGLKNWQTLPSIRTQTRICDGTRFPSSGEKENGTINVTVAKLNPCDRIALRQVIQKLGMAASLICSETQSR